MTKLPHDHGQHMELEFDHMPRVEDFQIVSEIFKQLCDGNRIRIFWLLCHCEECVINLSSMVGMSSPAVSHHLKPVSVSYTHLYIRTAVWAWILRTRTQAKTKKCAGITPAAA